MHYNPKKIGRKIIPLLAIWPWLIIFLKGGGNIISPPVFCYFRSCESFDYSWGISFILVYRYFPDEQANSTNCWCLLQTYDAQIGKKGFFFTLCEVSSPLGLRFIKGIDRSEIFVTAKWLSFLLRWLQVRRAFRRHKHMKRRRSCWLSHTHIRIVILGLAVLT